MPTLMQAAPALITTPAVGVYLTNEVFLYRVVGWLADVEDGLVELEDCSL